MSVVELPGEDLSEIVLRSLEMLGAALPGQTASLEQVLDALAKIIAEECSDRTPEEVLEFAEKSGSVKRTGKLKKELTPQIFPSLLWPTSGAFFRYHSLLPDPASEEIYQKAESFAKKLLPLFTQAAQEGKNLLDTAVAKKLELPENWMREDSATKALWMMKQALGVPVLKDGVRVKGQIPPLLSLLADKDFLYPEGGLSQLCRQEGWASLPLEERRRQLKFLWNEVCDYPYWKSLPRALGIEI